MRKLRCYLSQAITLLKKEDPYLAKQTMKVYDYIEEYLAENNIEVFHPIKEQSDLQPGDIYWRDVKAEAKADFLVAEVSVVSWGVGMELMYAIMKGKPILALYNKDSKFHLSEMVTGAGIRRRNYSSKNFEKIIKKHLDEYLSDVRQYLAVRRKLTAYQL